MAKALHPVTAAIQLVVHTNPKRGASAARYALYERATTVAEYLAAGGKRADLDWDAAHGYINVVAGYYPEEPVTAAAPKAAKATTPKAAKPARAAVTKNAFQTETAKIKAGRRAADPVVPVAVLAASKPGHAAVA